MSVRRGLSVPAIEPHHLYDGFANHGAEVAQRITDRYQAQGGKGALNALLAREMRMGPGSGLKRSRAVAEGLSNIGGFAIRSLKKHWKFPAIGTAAAVGIAAIGGGGGDIQMSDHSERVTDLATGPGAPHISPPSMTPNRIVTSAGSSMPAGYQVRETDNYGTYGIRQLTQLGAELNSSVRIRDNRGSITPEYIDKVQRERYY